MDRSSLFFFWALGSALLKCAVGQTVVATNDTTGLPDQSGHNADLSVSMGDRMVSMAKLLPLIEAASSDIPPPGLSGPTLLVNNSNQLDIKNRDIVVINCDLSAYPGNIGPLDIFATAEQRNATGVVWYSQEADWCDFQDYEGGYKWIYTMKNMNDTNRVLDKIDNWSNNDGDSIYATIGRLDSEQPVSSGSESGDNGDGGDNDDNDQDTSTAPPGSNNLGSSPTTAVAMIILYSVTGIVTALFLCIIITGAVRAHRHPERYGPRNLLGRARQSRARGLARAMLDTIPIVKFGGEGVEEGKGTTGPGDVEMAEGGGVAAATIDDSTAERASGPRETGGPHHHDDDQTGDESGATKAGVTATSSSTPTNPQPTPTPTNNALENNNNQGCSICTDDFELGQDQRVLPCNHRFHPPCIDPWLLNVSGTCPLCRIDLRPRTSSSQEEADDDEQAVDEDGNRIPRHNGDDELPPPLGAPEGGAAAGGTTQRMGVRRSLMVGILGLRSAERMSREEERVAALRAYRERQRRAVVEGGRGGVVPQQQEEEEEEGNENENENENEDGGRLRDRLRSAFRIRTRRAGVPTAAPPQQQQGEELREEGGEVTPATTATTTVAGGGTRRPDET
ncbi:hypothetical protein D0863_13178 [Hortaea werneckii]|uniref:RING-type E3 ubiquitin transferase n=1 Tax=Hortaea werneckii TaxID=91943 RepID=A0A3M7CVY3_HORWE|nr:hypothetical protein D0863_13178 [Hortaea werneckii]